jgi:hypothetical protein
VNRFVVAATANNRPEYLERVLTSWEGVRQVDKVGFVWRLEPGDHDTECQKIILSHHKLNLLDVRINERKLGVLSNPHRALEDAFNIYAPPFVNAAEDDALVAPDILEYFLWASAQRLGHVQLWTVCTYNPRQEHPYEDYRTSDLTQKFSALCWGVWQDNWRLMSETWDHNYTTGSGQNAGWDWNFRRVMKQHGMFCLRCRWSRSQHIGEYGGTHVTPAMFPSTQAPTFAGKVSEPALHEFPWSLA